MSAQDYLDGIVETRNRVWSEAQGFLESIKGREMSGEENAQWTRYNERIDGLAKSEDEIRTRERNEREAAGIREAQTQAFGREPDDKREGESFVANLRAWANGEKRFEVTEEDSSKKLNAMRVNLSAVAREREYLRAGATPEELRAMTWDTGSSASVVPTILDRSLYEVLAANMSLLQMPTTRINTESGAPMDFGRVTTHAVATQVSGQGTTLAGTDPAFLKLTLTPAKHAELIKVAAEIIADNGVDLVSFISRDIGRAVGRQVNTAVMGTLIASAVVGSAGTVSTGGTLITPGYNDLINLQYSIFDAYRDRNTAWLMNDSTAGTLRKLRSGGGGTEGVPIWQPSTFTGISDYRQPDGLLGYPVFTDPTLASQGSNAKIIFFGDWTAFYLRTVGDMLIERNDSVLFQTDEIAFRGKWRATGGFQDLTAVNLLKQSV